MEFSNIDLLMSITAALDNLAKFLSSSFLSDKLLMLWWIKWSFLQLKTLHLLWNCSWSLWRGLDLNLYLLSVITVVLNFSNWQESNVRVQTWNFYILISVYRFIGNKVRLNTSSDIVISLRMVGVFHNNEHWN